MTRVKRVVAVYDLGRIFNHQTARSQFVVGVVWGISLALYEDTYNAMPPARLVARFPQQDFLRLWWCEVDLH
jgi:xanthine dehydrogenase YagR molybdenum-binding subunit